jgi:hypothetical protein
MQLFVGFYYYENDFVVFERLFAQSAKELAFWTTASENMPKLSPRMGFSSVNSGGGGEGHQPEGGGESTASVSSHQQSFLHQYHQSPVIGNQSFITHRCHPSPVIGNQSFITHHYHQSRVLVITHHYHPSRVIAISPSSLIITSHRQSVLHHSSLPSVRSRVIGNHFVIMTISHLPFITHSSLPPVTSHRQSFISHQSSAITRHPSLPSVTSHRQSVKSIITISHQSSAISQVHHYQSPVISNQSFINHHYS